MIDTECSLPVGKLKGEYVRRKSDAKTTYIVREYCRVARKWVLEDFEDMNRCIYVKTGTLLFAGFTF